MQLDVSLVISLAAILTMIYCLYLVTALKSSVPGGMVGKKWKFLMMLVALFTVGYMATPFFSMIPEKLLRLIVSCIFFFGALYVVLTVKLIHRIILELSE
jgi:hypothetical protein